MKNSVSSVLDIYEEDFNSRIVHSYTRVHLGLAKAEGEYLAICGAELVPSPRASERMFLYEGQEYWESLETFKNLQPHNKCKACMDHPDYALGLLGDLP